MMYIRIIYANAMQITVEAYQYQGKQKRCHLANVKASVLGFAVYCNGNLKCKWLPFGHFKWDRRQNLMVISHNNIP